jgi:hypothetical protein
VKIRAFSSEDCPAAPAFLTRSAAGGAGLRQVLHPRRPTPLVEGGDSFRARARAGDFEHAFHLGVEPGTAEVVRQFPSEQVLRQLAFFRDTRGELVDETT